MDKPAHEMSLDDAMERIAELERLLAKEHEIRLTFEELNRQKSLVMYGANN